MARPVDADSAHTYDSIVRAALDVLNEVGLPEKLSMRKVASAAEVSPGTIQYYFGSKTDLLEACLDGYYQRLTLLAGQLGGSMQGRQGSEFVEYVARTLFRFARRERALIKLRMATNAQRGELHPQRQPEFLGAMIVEAAKSFAPHITVDQLHARLAIQSMSSIMARMALLTDSELECLTDRTGEEGWDTVEEFVVPAARRMLCPAEG